MLGAGSEEHRGVPGRLTPTARPWTRRSPPGLSLARRFRRWEGLPYWLILPTVAYLALFFVWPMIQAFELSIRVGGVWTIAPFREMYHDIRFGQAVRFTLIFIAIIVPIQFVLALTMALVANSRIRGRSIFLLVFILPLGVSDLAAGLVWSSVFTEHGYLNTILAGPGHPACALHLDQPAAPDASRARGRRRGSVAKHSARSR